MRCNICGHEEFRAMGTRQNAVCGRCGAYERTRVMRMFIDDLPLKPSTRVLHLAPERGLYTHIRSVAEEYTVADIDLERYAHIEDIRFIDLCDLESVRKFGEYDLIIHSHVIEHLPCNWSAVLLTLHSLLSDNGVHIFSMPIYGACYTENLGPLSNQERQQQFGQFDHVRRFSSADLERTLGQIFKLPEEYDLTGQFDEKALRVTAIPETAWRGFTGHTVFRFEQSDAKFIVSPTYN